MKEEGVSWLGIIEESGLEMKFDLNAKLLTILMINSYIRIHMNKYNHQKRNQA